MKKPINILRTKIDIGLGHEFRFLHITDTHIAFDDPGNNSGRYKSFEKDYKGCITDYYFQAVEYAKSNSLLIVNTGDMIDFLSDKNFGFVDEHFHNLDYIYAAGNHDFCHCVGQAKEDAEYKLNNLKISSPHFKNDLIFFSRIVNGINFVCLDDSYYLINDYQLCRLKEEAAKGYPIILCVHVPFFSESLTEQFYDLGNSFACQVAAPEEYLCTYQEHRRLQQTPDEATLRAVEYIKSEPAVKAIISGHLHLNAVDLLYGRLPQIVTHGTFAGFAREVVLI